MKHYKNLGKRVLSLFVVFIMCVSLVPGTALAKNVHTDSGDCELCAHAQKNSDHRGAIILGTPYWYCRCCGRINRLLDDDKPGYAGDERACTTYPNLHKKSTFTAKAPTCIEPGYTAGEACDYCNTILSGKEPIPVIDHQAAPDAQWQFDETNHWKVCVTCSEKVQVAAHTIERLTGKCTVCEYECKHVYAGWNTDADDHTAPQEGHHWQTCTICGYTTERVSHLTVGAEGVTTNTSNPAVTVYYCVCGVEIGRDYCAHTEKTYTDNGDTHTVTCVKCGTVLDAAAEHTFTYTPNNDGTHDRLCSKCGKHNVGFYCNTKENGACSDCGYKKPACQHPGPYSYKNKGDGTHEVVCLECGETAVGSERHSWVNDKCEYCQAEKPEGYIPEHVCNFNSGEYRYVPAVIENGEVKTPAGHEQKCSICNEYGDWEQHSKQCMEWVTVKEATCTEAAKQEYTCKLCNGVGGYATDTKHPALGHQFGGWLQRGTKEHGKQCSVCHEWGDIGQHVFDQPGDKCICGLKNPKPVEPSTPVEPECKHPGTKLSWTNNGDGTHTVTCSCGNYTKSESHTYDLDGDTKCKCGAMKPTTPVEPEVCKHHLNTVPKQVPTCTEAGMEEHLRCSKCGKFFEAGPATNLNPTEVTEDSLKLDKLGHAQELVAAKEATCTSEGMMQHQKCTRCGLLFKGTSLEPVSADSLKVEKKPHTEKAIPGKAATCKESGLTDGKKCSVCGEILAAQTEIAKLPHTYGAWTGMEGSVNHTRVCTVCGDEETSAHVWDAGEVTTSATCEGAEVTTYTCTVCGLKHTEATGGALGHNAVAYATVPATCTTTGYTGGTYCSRCNAVITSRITIPALGHSYGAWTVTRAATCAAAGEETRTCARNSGHTETRTVAATGNHAWNAGVITTYPTYYSTGLRTYTCATCAATRTETIPQLTYTYDPGYTDPDPDPDPDYQPPVSSNRQPTTTIPDDNTPLGNTPNTPTVTIEDEDTPLANRPLPFIDVASGDWFRPYVSFVYGKGMMTGMSDTLFGPNVSTTRGMIVTIIYRMENASATGVSPFTDVERDEYYADPISWASDNGVVLGYSETLFGPKDNITREQMAAILYRYCVSKGIDVANYGDLSRFPDGDKVSDYAVEAMRWAVDRGLIAGMDDGRLDPTGTATRAQVATILNRFCEMIGA